MTTAVYVPPMAFPENDPAASRGHTWELVKGITTNMVITVNEPTPCEGSCGRVFGAHEVCFEVWYIEPLDDAGPQHDTWSAILCADCLFAASWVRSVEYSAQHAANILRITG